MTTLTLTVNPDVTVSKIVTDVQSTVKAVNQHDVLSEMRDPFMFVRNLARYLAKREGSFSYTIRPGQHTDLVVVRDRDDHWLLCVTFDRTMDTYTKPY